ncbi:integral membrane protein [Weissella kandleri]|uniref:Integral membrane protein n=1 Tax=Weissella kandleri TaxID=1616 RepID=A0A0R2JJH6_9LACO|nr:TMEM175 family protein [Weissella kandleri]KRN75429.1 integral membrane protein [Weissella kandleri]
MNKGRVEAFTDAIIAIIATIMILEFKMPQNSNFMALLSEWSYLLAYAISFFFIMVAWFNHHYMFTLLPRLTKKIFWVNNIWLFSMSIIPVSTAWVGRFVSDRTPEYFYFFIFAVWTVTYVWLSYTIMMEIQKIDEVKADKIRQMIIYQVLTSKWFLLGVVLMLIVAYFVPWVILIFTIIELIVYAINTSVDADQLF